MFNSMWLFVTEGCNLRCPYCFNPDQLFTRKTTITETAYRAIVDNFLMYHEAAGTQKRPQIVLFGGEPTLYPDRLEGIMDYAHRRTQGNIRFLIITNGTRLASSRARVSDWRRRFSLGLQLSIDGPPGADTPRTAGVSATAYRRALGAALDFLVGEGIPFNIRATMTADHLHEYAENYRAFVRIFDQNPALTPSVVIMPEYLGSAWSRDHYQQLPRHAREIVRFIRDRYTTTGALLRESFTERALRMLYRLEHPDEMQGPSPSICGFAGGLCGVGPDGEAYACHRVYGDPRMRIGNMRTGELDPAKQQAIGSVINNRAFLRPARELDFESCSQCDIAQVCMAACPADSCSETGALQPELRCSAVVYTFQSVFARVVREELWPLILSDPVARDLVAERVGARPPDSLPA